MLALRWKSAGSDSNVTSLIRRLIAVTVRPPGEPKVTRDQRRAERVTLGPRVSGPSRRSASARGWAHTSMGS